MLLSTEENVNYEFILPAKNTNLENIPNFSFCRWKIELDGVTRGQRDWQLSHACDWAGMCVLVDLAAALYHNGIREGRIAAPAAFYKFWPHC